jgi:hypothetical protein
MNESSLSPTDAGSQATLSHGPWRRVVRRGKNEVLQCLLGRDAPTHPLALSRTRQAPTKSAWQRFRRGNLIGIGFGAKESQGAFTGDLAVRVYVRRKIPHSRLSPGDRVPAIINGVATDVIAMGPAGFHARPVSFGAGISHTQDEMGSLGCLVTKRGDDAWYLLSACHVLARAGDARNGDTIVEPARPDDNAAPLAILTDFEPLKADGTANLFDAAIARLNQKTDVKAHLPLIGVPKLSPMDPIPYRSVRKYGAGTGLTLGVITDAHADVTLELGTGSYLFADVIQVVGAGGVFSTGGDSGALVVDALTSRPIGLIIGGKGNRSFVSPIKVILQRFGVQLAGKRRGRTSAR